MRMSIFNIAFATLLFLGGLAGCATPQYQTTVRLIPPDDALGQACVQNCEARKTVCQNECQARYRACAASLAPQVEARYIEALKQYEVDLRRYAMELRHYEMQLHFGWMHSYPHYGYPYYGFAWWDPWPWPYFPPPYPEPVMPTREGVRADLEKTKCQADCSCLPAYDTCFVDCGGEIVSETVCVKNCPPTR